jgi:acetolactate synthase II small subunit
MNHTIYIETMDRPAGLERLLRVIRHRGFSVTSLDMRASRKPGHLNITAEVTGSRPIDLLLNPLMKIYDVAAVELLRDQAVMVTG